MTPEERFERIERQIEFVVNQQGEFYADLQRLDARLDRLAQGQQRTDERLNVQQEQIASVIGLIGTTGSMVGQLSTVVNELAQAQRLTEEQLRETDRHLRETDEHLRETDGHLRETDERLRQTDQRLRDTDRRLNAFIEAVDRRFSGGNGKGS